MCEFNVVQKSNVVSPYIVVTGIAMACLSTSLGALFGAARILQAIARDEIYPISYGTFRLNFHRFDRFELDLLGHTQP